MFFVRLSFVYSFNSELLVSRVVVAAFVCFSLVSFVFFFNIATIFDRDADI